MTQLDTRIPLLYSERKMIVQTLYDLGFNNGASQGRQAGVEAVQNHLRSVASDSRDAYTIDLLLAIAALFDTVHGEYQDPTQAIRDRLTARVRARNGTS